MPGEASVKADRQRACAVSASAVCALIGRIHAADVCAARLIGRAQPLPEGLVAASPDGLSGCRAGRESFRGKRALTKATQRLKAVYPQSCHHV